MTGTKILWGQIIIVSLIVLTTTWAATQWTALRLGFQPQLGTPWFELFGWPIYHPPAFFWWWYAFDAYAPPIFNMFSVSHRRDPARVLGLSSRRSSRGRDRRSCTTSRARIGS
jgi:type IV secretory pathway TraG/TraD family ATPase VirD4